MKRIILILTPLFLMLSACTEKEQFDELQKKVDGLESSIIASVNQQIAGISNSVQKLETAQTEIGNYVNTLKEAVAKLEEQDQEGKIALLNTQIKALEDKYDALGDRIDALKAYLDGEISSAKEWATATFATLAQYNSTADAVTAIQADIAAINKSIEGLSDKIDTQIASVTASMATAIAAAETSIKSWVSTQLNGYWTIAQAQAQLDALKAELDESNSNSAQLAEDLDALENALDQQKIDITTAYTAAIVSAIETNNGVIDGKIATAVAEANQSLADDISAINTKLTSIEGRIASLEADVASILAMIQSISPIPPVNEYSTNCDWPICKDVSTDFCFEVKPLSAARALQSLPKDVFSLKAILYPYENGGALSSYPDIDFINIPIDKVSFNEEIVILSIHGGDELMTEYYGSDGFLHNARALAIMSIEYDSCSIASQYFSLSARKPYLSFYYNNVEGRSTAIEAGETVQVIASLSPVNLSEKNIEWSSSNSDVVSIDESGLLTAIAEGASTITAVAGKVSKSFIVNVLSSEPIQFADAKIKSKLITAFDANEDGELSYAEAAVATSISGVFGSAKNYKSFDEFQYFTGIEWIPESMFSGWEVTSIKLPSSIIGIGDGAFSGCSSLETIAIPDGVTYLGYGVFAECSSLQTIRIPDVVTSIGDGAFSDCSSLLSINIPNGVTSIGDAAFIVCSSLTTVSIPEGVTRIGSEAFEFCEGLLSITILSDAVPVGGDHMFHNTNNCPIYVPAGSVDDYKAAQYWSDYASRIQAIP